MKPEGVTEASCRVLRSPGPLPQAPHSWPPQEEGGRREGDPNQEERRPARRFGAPNLPLGEGSSKHSCVVRLFSLMYALGLGGDGCWDHPGAGQV